MPIEITDNHARINVSLLNKFTHYEQFGFETEPDTAMMLRR
jgi:hypothetical protein